MSAPEEQACRAPIPALGTTSFAGACIGLAFMELGFFTLAGKSLTGNLLTGNWADVDAMTAVLFALALVLFACGVLVLAGRRGAALPAAIACVAEAVVTWFMTKELGVPVGLLLLGVVGGLAYWSSRRARANPSHARWRMAVVIGETVLAGVLIAGGLQVLCSQWFVPRPVRHAVHVPLTPRLFERTLDAVDAERRPARLASSQVTVVNLWATWCGPCLAELPELAQLHAELSLRGGEVVLVCTQERPRLEKVRKILEEKAPGLPCLIDDDQFMLKAVAAHSGRSTIPVTLVLDENGRLVTHLRGRKSLAELREAALPVLDG